MKQTLRTTCGILMMLLVGGVGMAAQPPKSDAEQAIRVPPWYRSGAVLAPLEDATGTNRVLVAGTVGGNLKLRCTLVGPKGHGLTVDGVQWEKGPWRSWLIYTRRFAKERRPRQNEPFELQLVPESKKFRNQALTLTNLVLGPLYVVHVDPARDSHEMPAVSEAVRRQVRILVLRDGEKADADAQWMTAAEAADRNVPEFCGMPRALAERLVTGRSGAAGLVIIPGTNIPPASRSHVPIVTLIGPFRDQYAGSLTRPAGVVWDALMGRQPPFDSISASARYERAIAKERDRGREEKRERRQLVPVTPYYQWTLLTDAERTNRPFAVTAEVW